MENPGYCWTFITPSYQWLCQQIVYQLVRICEGRYSLHRISQLTQKSCKSEYVNLCQIFNLYLKKSLFCYRSLLNIVNQIVNKVTITSINQLFFTKIPEPILPGILQLYLEQNKGFWGQSTVNLVSIFINNWLVF